MQIGNILLRDGFADYFQLILIIIEKHILNL